MAIIRIFLSLLLFGSVACAALDESYATRFGLTNPENPPVHPDPTDETYAGGTVGQQEAEEYERKYRERDIFKQAEPEALDTQEQESEQ